MRAARRPARAARPTGGRRPSPPGSAALRGSAARSGARARAGWRSAPSARAGSRSCARTDAGPPRVRAADRARAQARDRLQGVGPSRSQSPASISFQIRISHSHGRRPSGAASRGVLREPQCSGDSGEWKGTLARLAGFRLLGRPRSTHGASLPMKQLMPTRVPLRCVQATAGAATARFRLWTEPADSDYEGSLDFKTRAAAFRGTRRASGRVLQTISLPDATFLREVGQRGWMRLHSSRWRQGSWDPFGVLDVVATLPALLPLEPAPSQ